MYTTQERIQIINWYNSGSSTRGVRDLFSVAYPTRQVPSIGTIFNIIQSFDNTGCVNNFNGKRNRRSHILTEEVKLNILCYVEQNPASSLRAIAAHFQLSSTSVHKTLKEFKYSAHKVSSRQQLSNEDKGERAESLNGVVNPQNYRHNQNIWTTIKMEAGNSNKTPDLYICADCNRKFSQKSGLALHMRTHREDSSFDCEECGEYFSRSRELQLHRRQHTGEKPFVCDKCDKAFTMKTYLKNHQQTHEQSQKPCVCPVCEKVCKSKRSLDRHGRMHQATKTTGDEGQFECLVCKKRFLLRCSLVSHMKTHAPKPRYDCTLCDKTYDTPSKLDHHMKGHSDEKPYMCPLCDRRSNYKSSIQKHFKRIHKGADMNSVVFEKNASAVLEVDIKKECKSECPEFEVDIKEECKSECLKFESE